MILDAYGRPLEPKIAIRFLERFDLVDVEAERVAEMRVAELRRAVLGPDASDWHVGDTVTVPIPRRFQARA